MQVSSFDTRYIITQVLIVYFFFATIFAKITLIKLVVVLIFYKLIVSLSSSLSSFYVYLFITKSTHCAYYGSV